MNRPNSTERLKRTEEKEKEQMGERKRKNTKLTKGLGGLSKAGNLRRGEITTTGTVQGKRKRKKEKGNGKREQDQVKSHSLVAPWKEGAGGYTTHMLT